MNLREGPYERACALLPLPLQEHALAVPFPEQRMAEELRLRTGYPLSLTTGEGERETESAAVTPAEEGVLYLDPSVPVYEYETEAAPADAGAAPLWALSIAAFALAAAALLLALPRRGRTKNDPR